MNKVKIDDLSKAAQELVRAQFDPIMSKKHFDELFACDAVQVFAQRFLRKNNLRADADQIEIEGGAACFEDSKNYSESYCVYMDGSLWHRDGRANRIWESARAFLNAYADYFDSLLRNEPEGYKHLADLRSFVDAEGW